MLKIIIALGLTFAAIIRGDIQDSASYAKNAIFGVTAGFMPLFIDMADVTELVKLVSSLIALVLVSISAYRAWKYKGK